MKLSEYAASQSVTWRTAYRWYREGKIPGAHKTPGGSIIVPNGDTEKDLREGKTVIYARVSNSSRRKTDLEYQAKRLSDFCIARGWVVDEVVKEVGSGLNDNRPKLSKILHSMDSIDRIVVEYKDRLTRFGFNYLDIFAKEQGCDIIVVNRTDEDRDDLVEDLVSIVTSFCARIYGKRRSTRKTEAIIRELEK